MTTISATLTKAKHFIPLFEAEILLAHVLQVSRVYLHTWPEKKIMDGAQKAFFELMAKRERGEPIAYLKGQREFWSLDLAVNSSVLIPRHETELLVELSLSRATNEEPQVVADLGTGSGAIALAIAYERSNWLVYAVDQSESALKIAQQNADHYGLSNISFHQGIWCNALPPLKFDMILSNPPYLAADDIHLTIGDLRFEPPSALIAAEEGLSDLRQIIFQAKNYLKTNGVLMLEHGLNQAENVASIFRKAGYTDIKTYKDLGGCDRVTIASLRHF